MEAAAPAAIADRESPHDDANALPLSPIARTMQAANLTTFRIWFDFTMLLLVIAGEYIEIAGEQVTFSPASKRTRS